MAAISPVIDCKDLKIAQTAQNNQLFQLLKLICTYDNVFYGFTRMLMRNNVWNSVVSKDSPGNKIVHDINEHDFIYLRTIVPSEPGAPNSPLGPVAPGAPVNPSRPWFPMSPSRP